MAEPYTDRFGYPLKSTEVARRLNSPKSRGYYDKGGSWVKLPAKKPAATEKKAVGKS